mgnify:FL=1|jgi:uncharacterized protein (TIGR02145 family)
MYRFLIALAFLPVAAMAQVNPNYDPDYNGDGCHTVADLIPFLQVFGGCVDTAATWMCGDALVFDGHQYATTQVGDQCWFAENLRSEHYANGDTIQTNISDSAWATYPAVGRMAVYGDGDNCLSYALDFDACDTVPSLTEYGRLYNWYAATDERNLCPPGWHVPSDGDWMVLEMAQGMTQDEVEIEGWRGTDQGDQLKSTDGWYFNQWWDGNGTDSVGFAALPGGLRYSYGTYGTAGDSGWWWSTNGSFQSAWYRRLSDDESGIWRSNTMPFNGMSVRCLRDTEQ